MGDRIQFITLVISYLLLPNELPLNLVPYKNPGMAYLSSLALGFS